MRVLGAKPPEPMMTAGGFGGGLERPESNENCFAEQNFLVPREKIRFSKGFPNTNFVFQKPSCGFRRAPRRSRPPSALPATQVRCRGLAPAPPKLDKQQFESLYSIAF